MCGWSAVTFALSKWKVWLGPGRFASPTLRALDHQRQGGSAAMCKNAKNFKKRSLDFNGRGVPLGREVGV